MSIQVAAETVLIPHSSDWKYLDNGSDQAATGVNPHSMTIAGPLVKDTWGMVMAMS